MPRPERPLDPSDGPIQAFAAELRKLRDEAGSPKYLQMARMTGKSRTALAEAAGGDHLPTWETVAAFVTACRDNPSVWRIKWERVHEQIRQRHEESSRRSVSEVCTRVDNDTGVSSKEGPEEDRQTQAVGNTEVLLRMWQEQRTQARQSENQRALMTIIIAIATIWALTYIVMQHSSGAPVIIVALILCVLGIFGALVSAKYYERFKMHMDAAQALRRRLNSLWPELQLEEDWLKNRSQHQQRFTLLYKVRLDFLWVAVHIGIAAIGLTLTIILLLK